MKFVKLTALFLAASIAFLSCKNKNDKNDTNTTTTTTTTTTTGNVKELIVNTWKPIQVGDNDPATDSSLNLLAGTTYQFTNDGKYIITGLTAEPFQMDYTIGDDGKTITLSGAGATDKVVVDKVEKDVLVLTTSAGEKITYTPK